MVCSSDGLIVASLVLPLPIGARGQIEPRDEWSRGLTWWRHVLGEDQVSKRIRRRADTNPSEGLQKYGDTRFADPTNKKYPIDTSGRIKAAWAYLHQPSNAAKYTAAERRIIQGRIRKAAKAM